MRQEMHQHLEKIAWEAFGDLSSASCARPCAHRSDRLGSDPQMAETLIREEIRKLQGSSRGPG
jgi:hypothetical protein